jgi:AsmA protein
MRAFKIIGIVLGSLVALVVLAAVAVLLLVDPNDHKDRIAAAVQKSTGRALSLPGDLKLSLFPWVAIETGEARLGNPPGFGDEPFLTLKRAKLSVKLVPLLKKQLEVGRIEIDGLDLRLRQNAEGRGNWEEWGGSDEPEGPEVDGGGAQQLSLAGIAITDSRIGFQDMVADAVNIDIGRVAPNVPIPVKARMQLVTAPGEKPLPLEAAFRLTFDLDKQRYQLADLALAGRIQPQGAPGELKWTFDTPSADLDLLAQTLAQTSFTAAFGDAKLLGQIEAAQLIEAPALKGIFRLDEVSPRKLMKQLGIDEPVTRDPAVLAKFSAQGAWSWQGGAARLSDLALVLDDSKLTGRFAHSEAAGMDFALDLDRIDLDRYQPPAPEQETSSEPIELPIDLLKPMRAKGTFTVGEIKVGGAHLTQLSAAVAIANQVARFGPLKARLYEGTYSGDINLDMRQAVPQLSMDEHMAGIDIAKLMKDFADSKRLSGKGNLDMVLTARGSGGADLVKTLNGRIGMNLQDGAVEGMDVWFAIAQAQSLIKERKLAAVTNTKRTAFDSFKATADVVDGVATTSDLLVASQLLRVTGKGSTNLDTQALDFTLTTAILKTPPGEGADMEGLERASIPVRITGTLTDPQILPNLTALVKDRVKQEINERKEEVKQEVKQELQEQREKVEEKVRDKVQDRLKDLLNR